MPGELGYDTGPFVNAALFCNLPLEGKDGVLSLIRVINRIELNAEGPDAPNEMPGAIVRTNLVVMLRAGKARGGQTLRIDIEVPDGTRRKGPEKTIHFSAGEAGGTTITSQVEIELTSAGLYWADIFVNDRLMSRVPLEVRYSFTRAPDTTPPT